MKRDILTPNLMVFITALLLIVGGSVFAVVLAVNSKAASVKNNAEVQGVTDIK